MSWISLDRRERYPLGDQPNAREDDDHGTDANDTRPSRTWNGMLNARQLPWRASEQPPCGWFGQRESLAIAPRPGSNVLLAGEPRLVAKLQPAVARRGCSPARAFSFCPQRAPTLQRARRSAKRDAGRRPASPRGCNRTPAHLRMAPTREPAVHNHPPGVPGPPILVKSLLPMAIAPLSVAGQRPQPSTPPR